MEKNLVEIGRLLKKLLIPKLFKIVKEVDPRKNESFPSKKGAKMIRFFKALFLMVFSLAILETVCHHSIKKEVRPWQIDTIETYFAEMNYVPSHQ